ncbi:U32 family peptidase [Methanobrevibacter ruminantium]|uniref:U32 family peptidase n=1 Tax=Methanobrevibacter ruminantium TaxID=83816 RepID=UPI0026ED0441|nr:U32 family peptidase [Methanobrevibacter ruminantium]
MKLPELLAPVGSAEHLKLAILSGANSIYLSGENFGARKFAENFTVPEIREAVKYAHLHNVKVYVTVNILIKEGELEKVSNYLLELYKIGVDAVLIQDVGIVKIINENIPKLAIHASTQMNLHNIEGIKWASEHNIKRVVLPRETEMNELKEIIDYAHSLGIEIEIFAHGALCYSYSGHCLLSSMQGGRSGNRGTCAQPCREKYELNINKGKKINPKNEGDYLLSPRDLSLFEHLDEIVNLEVDSIKIEGRIRSNDYVATVIKNYRKRLNKLRYDKTSQALNRNIKELERKSKGKKGRSTDLKKAQDKENIAKLKEEQKLQNLESLEELELVFNREFTTGHLIPKNNPMIMNRKKPGHQGLYIGKIHRYNPQTEEIHILLRDNLIHIPEKGDGILIETNPNLENDNNRNNSENSSKDNKRSKTKQDKRAKRKEKRTRKEINRNNQDNQGNQNNGFIQTYGFDISSKPVLKDSKDKHWRKREKDKDIEGKLLVIKRVRENRRLNFPLPKGSKVYLTKKNSLLNEVKDLHHKKGNHYIKKSLLELYFRIDSDNYPHLKGNLKLDNGHVITLKIKGENPWEEAIKKPISNETIKKQLLKIGDLPYYIEKITINNNKSLFSPISEINELRRRFFNELEEEIINSYKPKEEDVKIAEENINSLNENLRKRIDLKSKVENSVEDYKLSAYINSLEILKGLNKEKESVFDRIYLEIPPNKDFEEISQDIIENKSLQEHELNISYCVNFLKESLEISKDQNYKLIWKLPDIAHKQSKESIIKIMGILKKMNLHIDIMTSLIGLDDSLKDKFDVELYGNYPINAYNIETVLELNNYKALSISPEIYKENIKDLMEDYYKELSKDTALPELELLVHGNIESMITRKELVSKKQLKLISKYNQKQRKLNKNFKESEYYIDSNEYYLKNRRDQYYPIKTNLNEDHIIILNCEELCLIDEIDYLKSIGISSFSIDARWKSLNYINDIGKVYRDIVDSENNINESKKIIDKHCPDLTKANFEKGLK